MTRGEAFTIVAAVNNDEVLQSNLLLSPELTNGGRHQVLLRRGFPSASLAYNDALDEAEHDIVIFVHQDIYLPGTWFGDLRRSLAHLRTTDPNWGVLGCFGSRRDAHGGVGRVYTQGMGLHGRELTTPEPIETLDEILLVLRKSSGLRFDPQLPHYHLYGPDICMTATSRGMTSYAFQGFCVHNTNQLVHLPKEFYQCYRYIHRKWRRYLPIYTSCMTISALHYELLRKRIEEATQRFLGSAATAVTRVADPRVLAEGRGEELLQ